MTVAGAVDTGAAVTGAVEGGAAVVEGTVVGGTVESGATVLGTGTVISTVGMVGTVAAGTRVVRGEAPGRVEVVESPIAATVLPPCIRSAMRMPTRTAASTTATPAATGAPLPCNMAVKANESGEPG